MARTRLLKPGFFANEKLAELPFETRLLFAGLWCIANCRGQLEDRPKRIHAALFPYDHNIDVDQMLEQLDQAGFIYRYILNGISYIQICNFHLHQRPHPKETDEGIPIFPVNLIDSKACREFARQSRNLAVKRSGTAASFSLSPFLLSPFNTQPPETGGEQASAKSPLDATQRKQQEWFAAFWSLYWRKVGKKEAWRVFQKQVKTEATYLKVRAAVEKQRPAMLARDPERRPHASTWLNQERWNDEEDPPTIAQPRRQVRSIADAFVEVE